MKNIFAGIVAQMNSCRAVITLTLLALFLSINSLADWSTQRPDGDGPYGYWNSLALGPDLNPRIVYRDGEAGGNLRFLRWTGSSWQKETIETNFDSDGGHASLAISPTGDPRVSYFKTGVGLRFASKDGASWTYKTIDPEGGQYTSLKLDSSGMAHVSYYAADKLKYAKWDGVTWSTSAVEGGGVGKWSSLILDNEKHPYISYYDFTHGDLKLAHWTGSAWVIQTVDSLGDSGKGSSIALDPLGFPCISYYSGTWLKYAHWNGSSWNIQTVDSGSGPGSFLALDSFGNPVISYVVSSRLWIAYFKDAIWSKTTVDTSDGEYSSLALGNDGSAHIAYGQTYFNYAKNPAFFDPFGVITASTITMNTISWVWPDTLTGETGYRIFRVGDPTPLVDNLPANSTSWLQSGLTPNSANSIIVQGFNSTGTLRSITSHAIFSLASVPTELRMISSSNTSVTLGWSSNGNPTGTTYVVGWSTNNISYVEVPEGTALTKTVTGLLGETDYYFRVKAKNGDNVPTLNSEPVIARTLFALPGKPAVILRSTQSLTWAWDDISQIETGYQLVSSTSGQPISPILPANTTYWVQTGLAPNTAAKITVEIFQNDSSGFSPVSDAEYTLANPPTGTSFGGDFGVLTLTWLANGNPAGTSYDAFRSIDNVNYYYEIIGTTNTSGKVMNLTERTTTYYRVQARNGNGIRTPFDVVVSTFSTQEPPNGRPGDPTIVERTANSLKWQWVDFSTNEQGFRVVDNGTGAILSGNLLPGTTSWVQTGLSPNALSKVQVEAFTQSGTARSVRSYFSGGEYTLANPPTRTTVTAASLNSVGISWETNGNPPGTRYNAFYSVDDRQFTQFLFSQALTSATATGLSSDTKYFFRVQALNESGEKSAFDAEVSANTLIGDLSMSVTVDPSFERTIRMNGRAGLIQVTFPPNCFDYSSQVQLDSPLSFPKGASPAMRLSPTGVGVSITAYQPRKGKEATIGISYRSKDVVNRDTSRLVLARYDAGRKIWIPLPSSVDPGQRTVNGKTDHFSLFQVMEAIPATDLNAALIYPNPFNILNGDTQVHFSNLPPETKVTLLTIDGRQICQLTASTSGVADWNVVNDAGEPVASGVYYARLEGGGSDALLKVMVQR